ncbi:hypothetical protein AVEN_197686-1 [Araneus ventricosus]|uniref:Histone H4 n=1 Tax=Araneus ventricosus TaxID=182803 RepID=A0A4Y2CN46_ARAVE|nr:hypothetical protein AVEN_197686-1 [Araneus ventricosus]
MGGNENANTEKRTGVLHNKISYLKNSRNRISKRSIRTLKPTALFVERTRVILKCYLEKIIQGAITYAAEDKRKSISAEDIAKALKKRDFTRCDKSFSSTTSRPEEKRSAGKDA